MSEIQGTFIIRPSGLEQSPSSWKNHKTLPTHTPGLIFHLSELTKTMFKSEELNTFVLHTGTHMGMCNVATAL